MTQTRKPPSSSDAARHFFPNASSPQSNVKSRHNKYVEDYNARIRKIAASESVTLIDIHAEFQKQDYSKLLSADALHPNAEGHRVIFEAAKSALL
ncbi:MAG: SGNH/GDSL hydrolase family protein [Candidatus Liptonbacteria bacterium]|nr:SGNH/GDSL hydrolase family protein [Candidatus Liptonbacteria bacterium]